MKTLKVLVPVSNNVSEGGIGPGASVIDSVRTDDYGAVRWTVALRRDDGQRAIQEVMAVHNGTLLADATDGDYEIVGGAVTSGVVDQVTLSVALTGSGPTQSLNLVATVASGTWYAEVHRGPLVGRGM